MIELPFSLRLLSGAALIAAPLFLFSIIELLLTTNVCKSATKNLNLFCEIEVLKSYVLSFGLFLVGILALFGEHKRETCCYRNTCNCIYRNVAGLRDRSGRRF